MPDLNSVKKEFDEVSSTYETNRLSSWYKAHGDIILNAINIKPHHCILDIGCGTGWLLRELCKTHPDVNAIGIDISSQMIDHAKKKAEEEKIYNLSFVEGNWEDMSLTWLEKQNVNTIICASAFHYFSDPAHAIRRKFETLNEGGQMLLLERDKTGSPLTNIWGLLHEFLIKDHVEFYYSSEMLSLIMNAGFQEASIIDRIKKSFWKRKLFTNMVLISGRKL